jgi:hypothetical protein
MRVRPVAAPAAVVPLIVLALAGCASHGEKPRPAAEVAAAKGGPVALGREHYRSYCMNCHGADASGNGHLATLLKVPTPDLTRLAKDNGGTYPADRVRSRIDGSVEVKGHGARLMPVWGAVLDPSGGEDPEGHAAAHRQIDRIVQYLETVQVE